jgi:hypothetical protein
MSRTEALLLSLLGGLVVLVFIGGVIALLAPDELLFGQPDTPTPLPPPTLTPTPAFPNFMPTSGAETPPPGEPTPTNTRLPTATPTPPRNPTPTAPFQLPTLAFKPTETPTSPPPTIVLTATPTSTPIPPRRYSVSFEAEDTELEKGDCTELTWKVEGPVTVLLNGEKVETEDQKKVCPTRNTDYTLTTQLEGSAEVQRKIVRVFVR